MRDAYSTLRKALILAGEGGESWVACPYCGKRQFPVKPRTRISGLAYKCKGSKCRLEFAVEVDV